MPPQSECFGAALAFGIVWWRLLSGMNPGPTGPDCQKGLYPLAAVVVEGPGGLASGLPASKEEATAQN
jgi:hypothetical protein